MEIDELVKRLKKFGCHTEDMKLMREAASALEALTATLAPFQAAAAEYGIDAQTMLTLARSQIATAKENAELREAQRWIACAERLPEEYKEKDVLTYDSLGNIEGFEADNISLWNQHHPDQQVTHWMPLPDPPQKGE